MVERGFENQKLVGEDLAEIEYQPGKCKRKYRVIILRKNISVQKGERVLFEEVRYFFYITNRQDKAEKIVALANGRCDQENVIEQLKNGVNAMRMPVNDLVSNWAYMVMAALAWNLKAWYGLLVPNRERGIELVKMEFRRFLHAIMLLPCQVVRTGQESHLSAARIQPLAEGLLCHLGAIGSVFYRVDSARIDWAANLRAGSVATHGPKVARAIPLGAKQVLHATL